MTSLPKWDIDINGTITAHRDAAFWQARADGSIDCSLCYRQCHIAPGEMGWCGYRANESGTMALQAHGVLSALTRGQYGYEYDVLVCYKPGARKLSVGLTMCTAKCVFCTSADTVWKPERLPWLKGKENNYGAGTLWHRNRAYLHPTDVVKTAQQLQCTEIQLEVNEPLLSWEYSFDMARLAKAAGLGVSLFTNGFSLAEPVRQLAPFIDLVYFGIKGSADPDFYDHWMKAPDAVPYVLASLQTWHECGVKVIVGDVLAPPQMQTAEAASKAQRQLYSWITEHLGADTIYQPMLMQTPAAGRPDINKALLIPYEASAEYAARRATAIALAHEAGLRYATDNKHLIRCHNCNGVLLRFHRPSRHCEPCIMASHFCPWWSHEQYVTDGTCDHCGAATPIVTMSSEELAQTQQVIRSISKPARYDTYALD